ncbi:MAG: hypothetical protein RR144_05240 [Clostridia bacterium]
MKKKHIIIVILIVIVIASVLVITIKFNVERKLLITSLKTEYTYSFQNYFIDYNKAYFFKVQVPLYIINNDSIMTCNTKIENGKTIVYTVDNKNKSVIIEYTIYRDYEKLNREYKKNNKFKEVTGYEDKHGNIKQEKTFYVCTINSNNGREYKIYYENIEGFYITINIVSNNCILDNTYKELLVSYDIEEDTLEKYTVTASDGYYNFNFTSNFIDEQTGKSTELYLNYRISDMFEITADILSYRNSSSFISNINKNIQNRTNTLVYTFGSPYNITSESAKVDIQIGSNIKYVLQKEFDSEYKYGDNQKISLINKLEEKELVLKNDNKVKYYKRIYGNEKDRYEYIYAYTILNNSVDFVFILSGQRNEEYTEEKLRYLLDFNML